MKEIIRPVYNKEYQDEIFYRGLQLTKAVNSVHTDTPVIFKNVETGQEYFVFKNNILPAGQYDLSFWQVHHYNYQIRLDTIASYLAIYNYTQRGRLFIDEGHISENGSLKDLYGYVVLKGSISAGNAGNTTNLIYDNDNVIRIELLVASNKIIEGIMTYFKLYPSTQGVQQNKDVNNFGYYGIGNKFYNYMSWDNSGSSNAVKIDGWIPIKITVF